MITAQPLIRCAGVRHGFFTRRDGVSEGLYASRNCGFGSADARENVAANRARCLADLDLAGWPLVNGFQVHSAKAAIVEAPWEPGHAPRADALVTNRPGIALGVLAADCAPILLCDPAAGVVGAAHAGWKGALGGILEATVTAMATLGADPSRLRAAVGPRIGKLSYEVGAEFRDRFLAAAPEHDSWFAEGARPGKHLFDLAGFIAWRGREAGVSRIAVAEHDTLREADLFFSYRRACLAGEPDYGRCLSVIALEP